MDFKKLGEVETVEEILDTDTVLVARDGQIYRADKSKVGGGAGGYLLEPADAEIVEDSDSSGVFYITSQINDMLKAIEAGATVTIKMDGKHFGEGMKGAVVHTCLIAAVSGEPIVPSTSSTSTTSVNTISAMESKLHDKPVVTEAADGVD